MTGEIVLTFRLSCTCGMLEMSIMPWGLSSMQAYSILFSSYWHVPAHSL
jgi:hypothetical protein